MTQVTPLYGCYGASPLSYLLKVNDTNILLDCGWTPEFDLSVLEPLRAVAADVDVVLISHPDMNHCGALPYAISHLGLTNASIYMTKACEDMAKVMLRDIYRSRRSICTDSESDDVVRSILRRKDVEDCFLHVTGVEFGAPEIINPTEDDAGDIDELDDGFHGKLLLKAVYAGRLLGGAVWEIKTDVEEMVYAVGFASTSSFEHVVPGIDWDELKRPTHRILITDAYHTPFSPHEVHRPKCATSTRKDKVAALQNEVRNTLQKGGNVLMPVTAAGRVLELVSLLEEFWSNNKELARSHPIFICGHEAKHLLELAANNVVSMKRRNRGKASSASNAFADLHHFPRSRCICNMEDLLKHPDYSDGQSMTVAYAKPSILVIATDASLGGISLSRQLFERWSQGQKNVLICTEEPLHNSLAHRLLTGV
jgi:cleavage and polyadenylation specificity factor subunit 2